MAFGIYVHIPYCLQLCPYCDFTKYEWGKTLAPEKYTALVLEEIKQRAMSAPQDRRVDTVYFGGGTPSLLEPSLILSILEGLAMAGFRTEAGPDGVRPEITIEIDPATVDQQKLDAYLAMGINRFSVGAQSFNDRLLKIAGRKHSAKDTVELLSLMKSNGVNYSFDLLFALPSQTLAEVSEDVERALEFDPSHVSAYCLTVPEGHKMSRGRAPEEVQVEMFDLVEDKLGAGGILRYEISNFAKPGRESRHNSLYWKDAPYVGFGLSSHSYLPPDAMGARREQAPWGMRFWNARAMKKFEEQIRAHNGEFFFDRDLPKDQVEILEEHQALTDYLHTSLRVLSGLDENALRLKFGEGRFQLVQRRFQELEAEGLISRTAKGFALTRQGRLLANVAFEKLTFLEDELRVSAN